MKKNQLIIIVAVLVVVVVGAIFFNKGGAQQTSTKYPERTVNNVVAFAAGGGTDAWNRALSAAMEKDLGQKVIVNNMTGGGGGIAMDYVWTKGHDGYNLLGGSETLLPLPVMGGHKTTAKDWHFFIAGGSPGVLCVKADSPYKTFDDLVAAAKANPGKIKISHTGLGSLWHIKAGILEKYAGVPFAYPPYDGSRGAIMATMTKETEVCVASTGEVNEFVKAGQLRPIVALEPEAVDFPGFGKVPAVTDKFPELKKYLPLNQWLGFLVPADTPKPILDKITAAYNTALKSDEVKKIADQQLAKIYGLSGKEADDLAAKMQSSLSWILKDMGIAKEDPAKLNIPKP